MAQVILNLEPDEILRAFTIGAKNEGFVCCSNKVLMQCPAGSPHETKSHSRTELLVTINQSKIRTVGARKPPMMAGFQAEENLTGRVKKNARKILDVI